MFINSEVSAAERFKCYRSILETTKPIQSEASCMSFRTPNDALLDLWLAEGNLSSHFDACGT